MNKYKKLFLIFSPLLLALLFTAYFFGIGVFSEKTIDVNIHDTYYVFSPLHFVIALTVLFLVIIYPGWYLYYKLKKYKIAHFLFLVILALLLVLFSFLMIFNHEYTTPDFSSKELKYDYLITSDFNMGVIQFLLIIVTIYVAFKSGQKFNTRRNEM
jgi:hypothetical protein